MGAIDDDHTWKTKEIDRCHWTASPTAKLKYIPITYPLHQQKIFELSKSMNSHSQFHSTHYELVNGEWPEAPRAWTKFTWREIYPTSTWNQLGNTLQSDPKFLLFPNLTHTPLPIAAKRPEHSLQDAWWPAHPHKRIDSVTCQNTWLIRWHRWKASEVSNQNKHWIEIDILSCDCEG